ncbi:peroxisome biogenesis protein 22 [Babesia caballi]|uniref:Peroxisome biogenesis protein 22 n=1 Tax=Babesia caballi TaxID=5871 RepID=A0AAV4LPT8_BABCB|nr:peroxisome biogenesis protein 22 [Babesia caballi]
MVVRAGIAGVMKTAAKADVGTEKSAIFAAVVVGVLTLLLCGLVVYFPLLRRRRMLGTSAVDEEKNRCAADLIAKQKGGRRESKLSLSLYVNNLIFSKGTHEIVESNVPPLAQLGDKCNLYLFVQVPSEDLIVPIREGLVEAGAFEGGLKKHRVMFSTTSAGRSSMVRQLQPVLHMESDESVVQTLLGKVPNLVQFEVDDNEAGDEEGAERSAASDVVKIKSAADIIGIVEPLMGPPQAKK